MFCNSQVCSGEESTCQCRRHRRPGFSLWVGMIPWRRKWQPTPVFLPGKFHGQRSLVDFSPWGGKELDMTEHTCTILIMANTGCFLHCRWLCFSTLNTLRSLLPTVGGKNYCYSPNGKETEAERVQLTAKY